jgi:drug/metabolite transporter (DMT)-like permease
VNPPPAEERGGAALYGAFAACIVIWGSTFLAIRIGNDTVPPLWAATLRLALASGILIAVARATGQPLPRGAALQAAAWYGFLVFGVNFALLYWGEMTVPSGTTAVLYATIPLSTALFARIFGLERLSALKTGGAVIAMAGVAAIFSGELGTRVPAVPLLAISAGTLCASLGGVLLKRGPRQSALASNAVGAGVGAVICYFLSTLVREPHVIPRSTGEWFPILYLTIAGSVGAFVLYAWLLKHWSATRASTISVIVPIVALLLGALVRHERLTGAGLLGTFLVLAGVILAFRGDG